MGHHDCKCSHRSDKHRQKHKHSRCHKKVCIDRSLITQLPNALSNAINERLVGFPVTPADPIMAVGPKSVISMINISLSIHRKDTMEEIFVDTTSNFWAVLGSGSFFPVDVYVVYDEFSKRFFLIGIRPVQTSATEIITLTWIAVSKNS